MYLHQCTFITSFRHAVSGERELALSLDGAMLRCNSRSGADAVLQSYGFNFECSLIFIIIMMKIRLHLKSKSYSYIYFKRTIYKKFSMSVSEKEEYSSALLCFACSMFM